MTIGYLQSKMIRSPLNLNNKWNEDINNTSSREDIIDYITNNGTTDEYWRLIHAIKTMDEINEG